MTQLVIRSVERFPEPAFAELQRAVFADVQERSEAWGAVAQQESGAQGAPASTTPQAQPPMVRFGAYQGADLVGWSYGWMERGRVFYMANSGVLPSHRRKGVYTALLGAVRDTARASGAVMLRSQHSVLNNPVLIAKLHNGFHVSGLSQSAQMGALVELTCHLSPARSDLFRSRVIPFVGPDPAGGSTT